MTPPLEKIQILAFLSLAHTRVYIYMGRELHKPACSFCWITSIYPSRFILHPLPPWSMIQKSDQYWQPQWVLLTSGESQRESEGREVGWKLAIFHLPPCEYEGWLHPRTKMAAPPTGSFLSRGLLPALILSRGQWSKNSAVAVPRTFLCPLWFVCSLPTPL